MPLIIITIQQIIGYNKKVAYENICYHGPLCPTRFWTLTIVQYATYNRF